MDIETIGVTALLLWLVPTLIAIAMIVAFFGISHHVQRMAKEMRALSADVRRLRELAENEFPDRAA